MEPTLHIYIWCLFQIFIFIKFFSNTAVQGAARKRDNAYLYPEDLKVLGKGGQTAKTSDAVMRATSLWRNDLENFIPFNFLALAGAIVQINVYAYIILIVLFSLTRITHAFMLIKSIQPGRTIAYALGIGCDVALVFLICVRLVSIFSVM